MIYQGLVISFWKSALDAARRPGPLATKLTLYVA